jgi:ESS family glutamate:Na+ symporter
MDDFFPAAGILLPFGFGQGTGQAMNYGNVYELDYGFAGGKSFGLAIAALGFISASLGGVVHLNILRRKGLFIPHGEERAEEFQSDDIQASDEIPMNGSVDKITVQMGFVLGTYLLSYLVMFGLGQLLPGLRSILYGFNFLFGVLIAVGINSAVLALRRTGLMKRRYINEFLMNRISGFFFDLMIVAGIAAIELDVLKGYLPILLILGVAGLLVTYFYIRFVCRRLFPEYEEEQFLAMYGMLTGTASTGIVLLRELDRDLTGRASENLVYQNLPAMVFGFPMMIVATLAPQIPYWTLLIILVYFLILNLILFRNRIFRKRK